MEKSKARIIHSIVAVLIQFFLFILAIRLGFFFHLHSLEPRLIVTVSMDYVGLAISAFLYLSCIGPEQEKIEAALFRNMIFVNSLSLFFDAMCWLVQGKPEFSELNKIFNTIYYLSSCAFPFLAWLYEKSVLKLNSKKVNVFTKMLVLIVVIDTLAIIFNYNFGYYFTVDFETGIYCRGKYYFYSLMVLIVMGVGSIFFTVITECPIQVKIAFLAVNILPYFAVLIQNFFFGVSFTYIATLMGLFIIYMKIHFEMVKKYIKTRQLALDQQQEINNTQTQIMLSQIQPHFLYNTLTTIHALCTINPKKAADITEDFANYLRGNISFLNSKEPIPFETEINHTKIYTEIEQERFDNIKVIFDIKEENFDIPALTVQPLVENAIRHGIRIRENGIVKVCSYRENDEIKITVEDNGKGFVQGTVEGNGNHIGLKNITERIKRMSNGSVNIESILGMGTKITITLPVKNQEI